MEFFHWFSEPIKNQYADLTGRTSRKAFWMYVLVYLVLVFAISFIEELLLGTSIPSSLFFLAVFIPSIAITARRLHDIGMSGWWQLLQLIPIIGWIIMIFLLIRPGEETENKYGPSEHGEQPTEDTLSAIPQAPKEEETPL